VKAIFEESHGSSGARTIATIATTRDIPLSRYRADKLMKQLDIQSCQLPTHRYIKENQAQTEIPNHLGRINIIAAWRLIMLKKFWLEYKNMASLT